MGYRNLKNEPVSNTCPTINNIKDDIKDIHDSIDYMIDLLNEIKTDENESNIKTVTDFLSSLDFTLYQKILSNKSDLEEIRTANSALRDWGNELVEELNKIEEQLEKMENE